MLQTVEIVVYPETNNGNSSRAVPAAHFGKIAVYPTYRFDALMDHRDRIIKVHHLYKSGEWSVGHVKTGFLLHHVARIAADRAVSKFYDEHTTDDDYYVDGQPKATPKLLAVKSAAESRFLFLTQNNYYVVG